MSPPTNPLSPSRFSPLKLVAGRTSTDALPTISRQHISHKREMPSSSRIQRRSITYSSCSTSQTSTLKTSVSDAISMAKAAYTAAGTAADYFTTW